MVADPRRLDADVASRLLQSPLAGLDSIDLRRLGRALRDADRADIGASGPPASSADLVRAALLDPDLLEAVAPGPVTEAVEALAALLAQCRDLVERGGTAHQALWCLWSGTDWPQRLQSQLTGGGDPAARAHRDLDAVCALFDVAERSDELAGGRGVAGFLGEVAAQEIPADTAREATAGRRGVRVLTAHRAKGLEWPLVVVASVQEGIWPDPRRRASLLEADRLERGRPRRAASVERAAGRRAAPVLRGVHPRDRGGSWSPPCPGPTARATSRHGSWTSWAFPYGPWPVVPRVR